MLEDIEDLDKPALKIVAEHLEFGLLHTIRNILMIRAIQEKLSPKEEELKLS